MRPATVRPPAVITLLPLVTAISANAMAVERSFALEEVIVTAQKRDEAVQKVPVAMTALTSDMLDQAGIRDISQINAASPSVSFSMTNNAASSANLQIRGIGTVGNARVFEGAVGVFIDGIYRSRAGAALSDMNDVEGLEILRGPQGTLFGKNTSAGAVILRSKAPDIGSVGGDYQLSIGNYHERIAKGALNLPLTDSSALRVAAVANRRDGFIESSDTGQDYNGVDRQALKLQYLIEPREDMSVRLIADYSEARENCCYGSVSYINGATAPLIQGLAALNGFRFSLAPDPDEYDKTLNYNTDQVMRDRGMAVDISWEVSDTATLRSITGYRSWSLTQNDMDADFSPADIFIIDEDFSTEGISQEFVLNGYFEKLPLFHAADYVVGLYYADEELDARRTLFNGPQANIYWNALLAGALPPSPVPYPLALEGLWGDELYVGTDEMAAIFTHWGLALSDDFKLIFGLRYSVEKKDGGFEQAFFDFPVFALQGLGPNYNYTEAIEDEAVTGTLGVQYDIGFSSMAYATYSRGFKSGGVNLDVNAGGTVGGPRLDPTYKPEFVDNYEIGLKSDYWEGRARTNLALFYSELEDLQFAVFLGNQFTVQNAARGRVHGVELENTFAINENLTFNLALTYLDTGFNGEAFGVLAKRDFVEAPHLAGSVSLSYERSVASGLNLFTLMNGSYRGERYTNTANNAAEGATTLVDFGIGLRQSESSWELGLWCRNCTDERYLSQHFNTVFQPGSVNGYPGSPRQVALTVKGSF